VRSLVQPVGIQILNASLGAGESEALALALEMRAGVVLIDDKAARRLAAVLGLQYIGVLGLLLKAKEAGLISAIRPRLDALRRLPFHIGSVLYESVLRDAGE
jgi:predicted nucleic acid-binding protein